MGKLISIKLVAKRFDNDLVEYLESHVVKLTKFAKYVQILKTP